MSTLNFNIQITEKLAKPVLIQAISVITAVPVVGGSARIPVITAGGKRNKDRRSKFLPSKGNLILTL